MNKSAFESKALLIEDDHINQEVACFVLNRLHCKIDIASTGAEAISLAKENRYNIILSDLGLPDMNGVDLLREIRGKLKITTPVIILTAHGDYLENECFNAGANDFFVKPIDLKSLEANVQKWLAA